MLPFQPETIEQLKARYPKALIKTWIPEDKPIENGEPSRPGLCRDNVFDFEDGIRLVISMDLMNDEVVQHLSGSFIEDIYKGQKKNALDQMARNFWKVSGIEKPLEFLGLTSGKGVPHWIVR